MTAEATKNNKARDLSILIDSHFYKPISILKCSVNVISDFHSF